MCIVEFNNFVVIAMAAVIAFLLWLRIHEVSTRLKERHEARLAERDRIARELHDTLLQGMEGLILKIYAAARLLPHDEPTRALLTRSLDQFEELATEGRRRLLELRDPHGSRLELSQALATVGLELSADSSTMFSAGKTGRLRALNTVAWDEIFSIAREAVGNAFKHSNAPHIETKVLYGASTLTVLVRDDGSGMRAPAQAAAVAIGHFGIRGMHERARQLRASLEIKSAEGGGTLITLQVPGHIAYYRGSKAQVDATE